MSLAPVPHAMRLGKYLAHAGVASRRAAEKLIADGRVTIDGRTVTDPARSVDAYSRVTVDGRPLRGAEPRVVYAVNKPVGVVSTARDSHGRPTVVELVRARGLRLYPVGRLDADSSGLILLTNDGELANQLMHPRYEVPRTYMAKVQGGFVKNRALERLREGVVLEDGKTAPAQVRQVRPAVLELTIREGRKRQVKRMCEAVGHRVLSLRRVAFGPLELGRLPEGQARLLTPRETRALRAAAGMMRPDASVRAPRRHHR
jgi:23S rRNA pseudouridine2605 synthase